MSRSLLKHIARMLPETPSNEYDGIARYFEPVKLRRKENLLREGQVCQHHYFVEQGCLRMFFVNEKGVEQTMQFALEDWWLADYASFSNRTPSAFFIQAVEKSEVLALTLPAQEELLKQYPVMERYFRLIHQRAHAAAQFRIKSLYELSREEAYHQFLERHPGFVQRIPQYLLASFLGFTPEYLSEIRNRRIS